MRYKFVVIFILAFVTLSSLFWYKYFNREVFDIRDVNLEMNVLDSKSNKNAISNNDGDDSDSFALYDFEIINKNTVSKNYTIEITDLLPEYVKDGCNMKTLLNRGQLSYKLFLNNKLIANKKMSEIKNNILDSRKIDKKASNRYKLFIWISDNNEDNWLGKHYHYIVDLLGE